MNVKFKFGTREEYEAALEAGRVTDNDLCFVTESGNVECGTIYKGGQPLGTTAAGQLKLTKNIQVNGGPLADLISGSGVKQIQAGTALEDLLEEWLCKELWPENLDYTDGSVKVTFSNPSVKITGYNNNAIVEPGTAVTLEAITGTAQTVTDTPRKYSGFTYGYGYQSGDEFITGEGNPQAECSVTPESGVKYSLTRMVEGFGDPKSEISENTSFDACRFTEKTLTVQLGTNKVTATMTGPKANATITAQEFFGLSNMGNHRDETKLSTEETSITGTLVNGVSTFTITGAYKYYIGEAEAASKNSADIKSLTTTAFLKNTITLEGGTATGGKTMNIAVQEGYELSSILNGFGLESKESFTMTTVEYELADGTKVNYNVYSYTPAADWEYKSIVIKEIV